MDVPYTRYKEYMTRRHGAPLFRVPIDFNLGCPNREADGSGGCSFCNAAGSRAVQTMGQDSVKEQMAEAIRFARDRYHAEKFMAYIQAFTATFGSKQQALYLELLEAFDFAAISIGTRPDCLTPKAYAFLTDLNQRIEVWVELGVQTVHDHSLERINRGHDWAASERAIRKLHQAGIKVGVHVILGLPGETAQDYQQTADVLASLPIDAVKIHNLHIVKGSTLAAEHARAPLPVLMEHDFAEHLMDFIRRLPPAIPVMRITTDTPDDELIAPRWNMAKGQFIDYVTQQMICREWRQGDLYGDGLADLPMPDFKKVPTEDGSITFWSEAYREYYHPASGARCQAEAAFLKPGRLEERLSRGPVDLLDIGFGLGYNSRAALDLGSRLLSITALEMDRRVVRATGEHPDTIQFLWGDARYTVTKLAPAAFDLVFLDPFSPQRNSELWTVDFFRRIKSVMKPDALLVTACAAMPVRAGLIEAGFRVGDTGAGTVAALESHLVDTPLVNQELEKLRGSTRGLPFRDPHGIWTPKEIQRDRQERIVQAKSPGERVTDHGI